MLERMQTRPHHPHPLVIAKYRNRTLDVETAQAVADHLSRCAQCRAVFTTPRARTALRKAV